jgi:hypothetical protein
LRERLIIKLLIKKTEPAFTNQACTVVLRKVEDCRLAKQTGQSLKQLLRVLKLAVLALQFIQLKECQLL